MPTVDTLLAFLGISVLITLAPGPDNLMVIGQSLARGRRAGLAFGLGCAAGCLTHIAWATLGIAALIRSSAGLLLAVNRRQTVEEAGLEVIGDAAVWQRWVDHSAF